MYTCVQVIAFMDQIQSNPVLSVSMKMAMSITFVRGSIDADVESAVP